MTLVSQGPFGGVTHPAVNGDGVRRGVKQWMTTPSFVSCNYTAGYDAELAAKALSPYAGSTIGLVGTAQMSFALVDYLQKGRFSNTRFVEAGDLVDTIKAIKSAEEQELIRRAAAMQDGSMRAAFAAVEPGMRDRRYRGNRSVLRSAARQRKWHLPLCLDAAGQTGPVQPASLPEPRHSGR